MQFVANKASAWLKMEDYVGGQSAAEEAEEEEVTETKLQAATTSSGAAGEGQRRQEEQVSKEVVMRREEDAAEEEDIELDDDEDEDDDDDDGDGDGGGVHATAGDAMVTRATWLPLLYNATREAFETGVSPIRPMYYEYPEEDMAYATDMSGNFAQYLLLRETSC